MFLKTLLLSLAMAATTLVQANPADTIKIVIGFSPGGGSDRIARSIQEILEIQTGKKVIVDYRPGAGGDIASREVANDVSGQPVLLLKGTSNIVMRQLKQNTVYDYNQLKPVAYIGYVPMVLVSPTDSKYNTLDSILNMPVSEAPNFGSSGVGSGTHVSAAIFFNRIGRNMTHVPYKGNSQVIPDLLASRLDLTWAFPKAVSQFVAEGRLNAIAVAGSKRLTAFPNTPTLDERNLSDAYGKLMYVFYASPGTSSAAIQEIQTALNRAFADPETAKQLSEIADIEVEPAKTLQVQQILDSEFKQYRALVQQSLDILTN
jgi:tripartite-type tricarboxylate transporter receptor subunit TctC